MRGRLGALGLSLACVLSLLSACDRKPRPSGPPPESTGLAAVPATAQAVIGVDVQKLADAPIVVRAIDRLLRQDLALRDRWAAVQEHCELDLATHVRHVMLALGPPSGAAGSGPVLMIVSGTLSEPDLLACLPKVVGGGGGAVTTTTVAGRSLYQVKDGPRVVYFAFGRPDRVVLGTSEAWVSEALGAGKKALDEPELARHLARADLHAPVWGVGRVDARVGQGIVAASGGKLSEAPRAILGALDPRDGARLELGVVMSTSDEARALESFARAELAIVATAARLKSLQGVVEQLGISTEGPVVRIRASLTPAQVNQLLSVLDETPPPEQGSPPRAKSESDTK